jgi:hypothetical protein
MAIDYWWIMHRQSLVSGATLACAANPKFLWDASASSGSSVYRVPLEGSAQDPRAGVTETLGRIAKLQASVIPHRSCGVKSGQVICAGKSGTRSHSLPLLICVPMIIP